MKKLVSYFDKNQGVHTGLLIFTGSKYHKIIILGYPVKILQVLKSEGELVEVKGSIPKFVKAVRRCLTFQESTSQEIKEAIKGIK